MNSVAEKTANRYLSLLLIGVILPLLGCNLGVNRQNLAGKRNFESGNYPAALASFTDALHHNPSNADAHYNVARTFHQLYKKTKSNDDRTKAEYGYRTALRLSPVHPPANRGLAVLLAEDKKTNEAFALLQNWNNLQPGSAEPKIELARLYSEHGNNQTAIQLLSDALSVDFDNDRALRAIGTLREKSGQYGDAIASYQRSLQINPMQPELSYRISQLQSGGQFQGLSPATSNTRFASAPDFPRYR